MIEESRYDRRQFIGAAAMTVAATQLRASRNAGATSKRIKSPLSGTSLGPVKQVQAGLLNVGYVEAGPVNGTPVVLLHGWPYDINAFVDVAPLLASKGFRVIVPYLRGYGSTRFLSNDTFRNGQPSAVALDTIALMDALKIDKAIVAGFGAYFCIKAFSETDLTEDLKKIDVPTLILHGDDDQIVPIDDSARLSAKIVRNATLKVYPAAPHGMCSTHKDKVNADLLAFIKGKQAAVA